MDRLPHFLHVPMFGFTVLAFLIVCGILAAATFLVFKSGQHGTTKLGGCAGCAIGFALLAIAGLAALISVGVMVATTRAELVRHGPLKSFELQFGDHDDNDETAAPPSSPGTDMDPDANAGGNDTGSGSSGDTPVQGTSPDSSHSTAGGSKDSRHPVHLKLVVRGKEYPAQISEWIRENTSGDVSVTISTQGDRTVVDLGLPITREDLKQFKRDLKHAMPGMKLPKGVKVEIKDAED